MERYSPAEIEARWQSVWEKDEVFKAVRSADKPKYYVLEMFPYPSGRIHMGHVRNYTMGDVIARYKLATGHNVLHPMGWDAFGMPAENAAMAIGGHPKDWTYGNIDDMRAQMKPLGLSHRLVARIRHLRSGILRPAAGACSSTCSKAGLIYRKNAMVNWDPVDMTVLANEQVIDGKGWRSGAEVERRELTQWFFKISDYCRGTAGRARRAGELARQGAADAGELDRQVARAAICVLNHRRAEAHDRIEVYTTRPDTLMGASFVGISPDHPLAKTLERQNDRCGRILRRMPQGWHHGRSHRNRREAGIRHRHPGASSV